VIGVVPIDSTFETTALLVLETLRQHGIAATLPYSGNLSKRFKKLDRLNCSGVVIVSSNDESLIEFKDFKNGTQTSLALSTLISQLESQKR
jgi:histidyl-tRNA synthetase